MDVAAPLSTDAKMDMSLDAIIQKEKKKGPPKGKKGNKPAGGAGGKQAGGQQGGGSGQQQKKAGKKKKSPRAPVSDLCVLLLSSVVHGERERERESSNIISQ